MNVIVLFILAGFIFGISLTQEVSRAPSKIEVLLYDRCKKHSIDATVYDDIKTRLGQFNDYLSYAGSLLPNGKEQFCNDEKPKLIHLAGVIATDVKKCLPKEERYLPKFFNDAFTGFLNFTCTGRNIENFFSTQGSECRETLKNNQEGEAVGNCFKKLFARFNTVVVKEDLCLDLKSAKKCFGEAMARSCPDFAAFESLNNRFFKAISERPCDPNSAVALAIGTVGSTVLTILTLAVAKIF